MADSIDGSNGRITSAFSQKALDLQNNFCCNDCDESKIIRWVGCKPGVYQGSKTIFTSEDIAYCSWFQEIDSYNYVSVYLEPGEIVSVGINARLAMVKASYDKPNDGTVLYESMKVLEIGIGEQPGYVGMTIPFMIDQPKITYTGIGLISPSPTIGGTGYLVGDILDVSTGTGGRVSVDNVSASGAVTAISIFESGANYVAGATTSTTGGSGTGCKINIIAANALVPVNYRYSVMKELYTINTEDLLTVPVKLNNISPYSVSVNILYAN